jgi:hypothetical protein
MNFREELGKIAPKIKKGAKIYVFGTGENWCFIRRMYRAAVHIDLEEYVDAFIDNAPQKQNTDFFGKKVISPDNMDISNSVILISANKYSDYEIERQLHSMGLFWRSDFFESQYFHIILKRYLYLQLLKFKNRHLGERCFIIGNGPSLKSRDLDKLINEVTFATNKIYLSYRETNWRTTYFVVEDPLVMEAHKEINLNVKGDKFYCLGSVLRYDDFYAGNAYFFDHDYRVHYRPYPYEVEFSTKPDFLAWGHTVTYSCLQLAAYMGFKEIYLLGVDNNFAVQRRANGEITTNEINNHFSQEYDINAKRQFIETDIDLTTTAYESARAYSEKNNIKIYNATRGGKLEVFERVDFDSLF